MPELITEEMVAEHKAKSRDFPRPTGLHNLDLFSFGAQEHWFDAYRYLHEEAPILKIPGEGSGPGTDGYIVSKYDDIAHILADPINFPAPSYGNAGLGANEGESSALNAAMAASTELRPTLEAHKQHRLQLTDPWVGATGAPRNREMITRWVDKLIDDWIDRPSGEVEFVTEFAAALPQYVMTTILGLPLEDMAKLRAFGQAQVWRFVFGSGHRNQLSAEEEAHNFEQLKEFMAYLQVQVTRKRQEPGDDMTTFLTQVVYNGRKLTDAEVISVMFAMHIGGLETTQYALAAEGQILARQPALFAQLKADRSKLRFFVEESLRTHAPTQGLSTRMALVDTEIRGVPIPAGSVLHLRYGAGNRDPEVFPNPDQIDLERPAAGRHLTFSQGIRVCPGAGLSRLEQNVAWDRLLDRLDSIELDESKNELLHQPGIMLGLWDLHLKFKKA